MPSQYEKGFYSGMCIVTFIFSSVMVIFRDAPLAVMIVPLLLSLILFIIWGYTKW